jgi:hypothetical protein
LRRVAIRRRAQKYAALASGGIALGSVRGTKRRRDGIGEVAPSPIRVKLVFGRG